MSLGENENPPPPGKSVLERTAVLLTCFDSAGTCLTLKQLCERTGLPKSTAHRFAERLVGLGWLERATGGYSIGLGLYEIGNLADQDFRLRTVSLPYLQRLAAATRCATQLAVIRGHEVEYLEVVPYQGFCPPTAEGTRMPLLCTPSGRVIAAFRNDLELSPGEPDNTRAARNATSRAEVVAELTKIRGEGVAIEHARATGISCVAAPVRRDGLAVAAISVCAPSPRSDPGRRITEVRRCASALWDGLVRAGVVRQSGPIHQGPGLPTAVGV